MNDNRNMILAIVLSALVLLGWSYLSEHCFPTAARRPSEVENGKVEPVAAAAGRSRPPMRPQAIRDRTVVLRRNPARADRDAAASQGSINLKGARFDDLVLVRQRETHRQEFAAGPPAVAGRAPGTPISPSFGWTGEGVAAPDANTRLDGQRAGADPGQAGDA